MLTKKYFSAGLLAVFTVCSLGVSEGVAADSGALNILKDGLLGAGVGAISAGTSGGKAGQGALIGAGTNVIGGALLNFLTGSSTRSQAVSYAPQPASYVQTYPVQPAQVSYVSQPDYYAPAPTYSSYAYPAQEDPSKKIIKQGLLGAGVGAISASTSGGKAGTGALIGAGTNVIGTALLDTLTSAPPAQAYYAASAPAQSGAGLKKHVVRKFGPDGKVISEEEFWE